MRGRVGAESAGELRVVEDERLLELVGDLPHGAKRGVHAREEGEERRRHGQSKVRRA
jgi:hypothetical protein